MKIEIDNKIVEDLLKSFISTRNKKRGTTNEEQGLKVTTGL